MPDLSRKCPQPEAEEGAGRKSERKYPHRRVQMPDLSWKYPQPETEEGAGRKSGEKIPTEEGTKA